MLVRCIEFARRLSYSTGRAEADGIANMEMKSLAGAFSVNRSVERLPV